MKFIAIMTFLAGSLSAGENWPPLKSDEQIVFYPSIAQRVAGNTNLWRTQIRGCVFEPERRRLLVAAFSEALELKTDELTAAESVVFAERARLFLVDHERGKRVFIRLGTNEFFVGKSSADGRFGAKAVFNGRDAFNRVPNHPPENGDVVEHVPTSISFKAALPNDDQRHFAGLIFPLEAEGVSVISDIDDTIKITEVRDKQATLRNTFLREFRSVPGMAEFYQRLARSNQAAFHYISASPWQLYEPLNAFVASNGFPAGTFELKEFRWKDRSFFSLFASPEKYKPGVIAPLLKQFPRRKFILIGDSGERDPEIYGDVARKFPGQILRIYIRDVTNEPGNAARYQEAFRGVPRERWQVFQEPGEVRLPL